MQRILIVRLSALGDLVFASTLLQGLLQAYPQARIDWLVQSDFADLLHTQPQIARVQVWERKLWGRLLRSGHWLGLWRTILAFRRQLRAQRYDCVIDAQGLAKSRLLAWLAGGTRRVGYRSKEPLGSLMHELVQRPADNTQIASEHRALVAYLTGNPGAAPLLLPPALPAPVSDAIVLAPFTTRPQKHWPEAHWAALIRLLAAQHLPLLLLGGPADAEAAQRIVAAAGAPSALHNLVGRTKLGEAAACIAAARAVVGVDTGLTHMGIAFDKPTVAIFGSTVPYRAGARAPLTVLWLGLPCSPCHRQPTCGGRFDCLTGIRPEQVSASLAELLRG